MNINWLFRDTLYFVKSRSFKNEILHYKKKLPFKYYLMALDKIADPNKKSRFVDLYKEYLLLYESVKYNRSCKQMTLEDFLSD